MGSCNAIFVQRRSAGVYWVWPGPTQVDHEPDPNGRNFIGQYVDRGSALCAAHDADHGTSDGVVELHDKPEPPLYRYRLVRDRGYVVYRHSLDQINKLGGCPAEEFALENKTAVFVTALEAADYCRYRNELTVKNGTDALPKGGA